MDRRVPRQTARKSTSTMNHLPQNRYHLDRLQGILGPSSQLLTGLGHYRPNQQTNTARKSTAFLAADAPRARAGPAYPVPHRRGMNQQEFGRNLSKLTRKSDTWAQSASSSRRTTEPEDGSCPACGWVDKPRVEIPSAKTDCPSKTSKSPALESQTISETAQQQEEQQDTNAQQTHLAAAVAADEPTVVTVEVMDSQNNDEEADGDETLPFEGGDEQD